MSSATDSTYESNSADLSVDVDKFDGREKSVLLAIGHLLLRHRRIEDAVAVYEGIRLIDVNDKYAMRALIYLYIEQSRYIDALRLVDVHRKISSQDNDVDYLCGLLESKALWQSGRTNDARVCFEEYCQRASITK